jgi:hypothetical protein
MEGEEIIDNNMGGQTIETKRGTGVRLKKKIRSRTEIVVIMREDPGKDLGEIGAQRIKRRLKMPI